MHAIEKQSLGTFVAACLHANGVETVFGIPGTHNIEIYRGLQQYNIAHVLTRHEQGATYAADGYARSTGRAGVVIATSGPGVTNCITGIANAYADSVPLLVISPGAPRGLERRDLGFLHEAKDQRSGIAQFARESVRAESFEAVAHAMNEAFLQFRSGRSRPIHIEIPTDLMDVSERVSPPQPWSVDLTAPSPSVIEQVRSLIRASERPLVVAGGGTLHEGEKLRAFIERFSLPVATTVQGKGVISENHEYSLGAVAGGSGGFPAMAKADLVIALGTELKHASLHPEATLIRCDIDIEQLHKHHAATVAVFCDVGMFLSAILEDSAEKSVTSRWIAYLRDESTERRAAARMRWQKLHDAVLSAGRTGNGRLILTGDSSQISWLGTVGAAELQYPEQFVTTDGYATLGYGLPAAIGAKIANPDARVVSLLGDGALMFSVQELMTASELLLGIPVIVLDNGGYEEIYQNMRSAAIEPFAVKLKQPEYEHLARGLGCAFISVTTPQELEIAVRRSFDEKCPTVIHVHGEDFERDIWRTEE